jgi:hypothetical protein
MKNLVYRIHNPCTGKFLNRNLALVSEGFIWTTRGAVENALEQARTIYAGNREVKGTFNLIIYDMVER